MQFPWMHVDLHVRTFVVCTSAATSHVANAGAGARAEGARSDWLEFFVNISLTKLRTIFSLRKKLFQIQPINSTIFVTPCVLLE